MTKMAATPIYGKKRFKILLLQNQRADVWPCGKVKFGLLCFYMGKTFRKSFNGGNLQQMTSDEDLCLYKNSDPKGLSAPAPGLYTCIKTWKIMYKIRIQRYLFWNLQQMSKVTRLFYWQQDFVHKGLSALALGLYTCGKTLKNVYNIRIQRDLFETCNKWSKW